MLTKEERAGIVERVKRYDSEYDPFYYILFGYPSSCDMPYEEYKEEILNRIFNLCDVSNMVELPLDKDGEVIRVGDTLYDDEGTKIKVCGFLLREIEGKILLDINVNNGFVVMSANVLTHKKPVTIASLVGEIRRTLSQTTISNKEAISKIWEITDQLEMLSDSDD